MKAYILTEADLEHFKKVIENVEHTIEGDTPTKMVVANQVTKKYHYELYTWLSTITK